MVTKVITCILVMFTIYLTVRILTRKSKRRRKVNEAKRIIVQSLPILLGCVFLELLTGLLIEGEKTKLIEHAVLMLMLTAFLNEGNALSGMLTSRLSSMLHIGTLPRSRFPPREAGENFGIMYLLATITFIYIMTMAFAIESNDVTYLVLLAIVLISGFIITTVINFLSYYVALAALKFGLDPDDHCIPITSSIMDVVSTVVLINVIMLFI
jgi:mgtE-like transporter